MSRAYTTMSRTTMATTILYYQPVDGRNTIMGGPSTTRGASSSQLGREGHYASHPQRYPAQSPTRSAQSLTQPPPLLHPNCIPLPALADVPIYINPLLSYNPSKLTLDYDLRLPPITAQLPPIARAHVGRRDWREQPAMNPSTVGSMTIVVPGLERVVVVFPVDSGVVTVGDVLVAVYRAVQESAIERNGEHSAKRGNERRKELPASRQLDLKANANTSIVIEEFGGDHWWAGLYPCHRERDVWVLRTRRGDHR